MAGLPSCPNVSLAQLKFSHGARLLFRCEKKNRVGIEIKSTRTEDLPRTGIR